MHDLGGQRALVTGGGAGIGRAFAEALERAGASVFVTGRSVAPGRGAYRADVRDRQAMEAIVEEIGPLDLLVNNAAVFQPTGPDWEIEPGRWWETLEVNLFGAFQCARAVLPGMIARGRGRIVNVSSGGASMRGTYYSAYTTSKAALTHWTDCLAAATAEHGIAVFAYGPGLQRTPGTKRASASPETHPAVREVFRALFDEGRAVGLDRAAEGLLFLASGKADALTGRYVSVHDDLPDLVRRAEEIRRADLHTLRFRLTPS